MAALPQAAESSRLYSWWWDSHVSPRNSKWLQEDLTEFLDGNLVTIVITRFLFKSSDRSATDMDARVKLMIRLIEEDGDSFAMRAEMYYRGRPELIKLVEEFYRAYRALAERYDNATRVLHQAHMAMTGAVHNRSCSPLDSPSPSSSASGCFIPRILIQSHSCCNADDTDNTPSSLPYHLHTPPSGMCIEEYFRRSRGLKQVYEMFTLPDQHYPIVQEQATERSAFELGNGLEGSKEEENSEHSKQFVKLQDDHGCGEEENQALEKCILHLKEENGNLHLIVEHMQKEMEELKASLQDEHLQVLQAEAALDSLKEKHRRLQEKLGIASAERQKEAEMVKEREARIWQLKENLKQAEDEKDKLKAEVSGRREEVNEVHDCINEECIHYMEVQERLLASEKLHSECESAMELLVLQNQEVEQKVCWLVEEMQILQDEKLRLMEAQSKLENEMKECSTVNELLQEENSFLKKQIHELDLRSVDVLRQMDDLRMELQFLQKKLAMLQDENSVLKEVQRSQEKEEEVLLEKLEEMHVVMDKNDVLVNSLKDASYKMEELGRRINALGESNKTLEENNLFLESEKDNVEKEMRKLVERNLFLQSSLGNGNRRLEEIEGKLRVSERTCWSLLEEKFLLCNELDALIIQVESCGRSLRFFEEQYVKLQDKQLSLEGEKESAFLQVSELQVHLSMERQEKEMIICSGKSKAHALHGHINHLSNELQDMETELENRENEMFVHAIESFIFQRCLSELKDKNLFLYERQEELDKEIQFHKGKIRHILEHGCDMKGSPLSRQMSGGINRTDWELIFNKIKQLQNCCSRMENEMHQSMLEKLVGETFLLQLAQRLADLQQERDSLGHIYHLTSSENEILKEKARQKFIASQELESENEKLQCGLLDTSLELCWADAVREELEKMISWLIVNFRKEIAVLKETNNILGEELEKLKKENNELRFKEEKLNSDLFYEVSSHEKEWAVLFEASHLAAVNSMFSEEKAREMMWMHKNLEIRDFTDIMAGSEQMESKQNLAMKYNSKEKENKQLKAEMDECQALVLSLKETISNLEDSLDFLKQHHMLHIQEIEDGAYVKCEIIHSMPTLPSMSRELQKLVMKLDGILNDVTEIEGNGKIEPFKHLQMPNLESKMCKTSTGKSGEKEICVILAKHHTQTEENFKSSDKRNEIIIKDIQLDQNSSVASYRGIDPEELQGIASDKMHEIWQTKDKTHDSEMECISIRKHDEKQQQQLTTSGNLSDETEMVPYKLQPTKRDSYSQVNWSNAAKQLFTDADRLTAVEARVWELRRKTENMERGNRAKNHQLDAVKEQLRQMQDSVPKLIGMNTKLLKKLKNWSPPFSVNNVEEMDEVRNKQRKVVECTRKESRKIGRLEMELQESQCILIELEKGIKRRKGRDGSRGEKVVLSDYLFGRAERGKSQQFCGCVETKDYCHVKRSILKERTF